MSDLELDRWRTRAEQALRDLEEVDAQAEAGDLDDETAARLRDRYRDEATEASARLDQLLEDRSPTPVPASPSKGRTAVGAGILALAAVAVLVAFSAFAQPRQNDSLQGLAASGDTFDPNAYSDETMEAVIAGFEDDPAVADQLPYMRFALADRYFERGDYQAAFPHYEKILESDPEPDLFGQTMTRLAWIVWVGNGETELALQLADRALEALPGWPETLYVKGQIVWCGLGDASTAVDLFDQVLDSSDLDEATRTQVETDRSIADAGGSCR